MAESGADVAQQLHPGLEDEGNVAQIAEVSESVPELEPMIARVRFGEARKLATPPVESSRVYDNAADGCPMTADELGGRGGEDVCAEVYRPEEADTHGVVHDQRDTCVMGYLCNGLEIRDV